MIDETNTNVIDDINNIPTNSPVPPSPSGKVKYCEKCKKQYDAANKVCPFCGHKNKYTAVKVGIGVMVGGTILFGAIPDMAKDKSDDSSSVPDRTIVTEADTTAETTTEIEITTYEGTTTAFITAEKQTEPAESIGEKNAKRKAVDYIETMAFSYNGLIKQLEFEGFTHEEAVYGTDNCGADWKEEAVKKANDYLEIYGMSRQGLKEQLLFEEFTEEEAEYALTVVYPTTEPERKLLVFTKSKESNTLHIDPYCGAVDNILPENKETVEIYEDELERYADQYRACGRCSVRYAGKLTPDSE